MTDHPDGGRPLDDHPVRRSALATAPPATAPPGSAPPAAAPIPELPVRESPVPDVPAPEAADPRSVVVDTVDGVLSAFAGAPPAVIGDEERTRYGMLLDRAAERGLLTPAEYEVRLRELAEATTVERMQELVTVLPVLESPGATLSRRRRGPVSSPPPGIPMSSAADARRSSPWVALAVMVVALVVALVVVAIYAQHLVHGNHPGATSPGTALRAVSALRS